jgi:hypothetical protein
MFVTLWENWLCIIERSRVPLNTNGRSVPRKIPLKVENVNRNYHSVTFLMENSIFFQHINQTMTFIPRVMTRSHVMTVR